MQLDDLYRLIDERNAATQGAARDEIEARIHAKFGRNTAVLISDMSGFSRVTKSLGIVHFLGLIRRMQILCRPIIEAHAGRLVKCEADNLFCAFPSAQDAVEAAIEMRRSLAIDSEGRPDHDQIGLSIGISWGQVLDIDGHDMFGDSVNMASKLGEDTASGGEILLTEAAVAAVEASRWSFHRCETEVSQLRLSYFKLIE